MIVLGIETSCDETAAAIVENGTKLLSNITATSSGLHARTGGIIPEEAARKQVESIIPVIDLALNDANIKIKDIDCLAVTSGPGLIGSLLVGVETAKTLSCVWKKPIVPINHLVAHIYANWITQRPHTQPAIHNPPLFPALSLIVSGGHTDMVFVKEHGNLTWISGTRDDAAGEAFDKCARLLGLPYPGGPAISDAADDFLSGHQDVKLTMFPRPMIDSDDFDWSFSGLKTAVLNHVVDLSKNSGLSGEYMKLSDYDALSKEPKLKSLVPKLAAEIQEAIVDSLVIKSMRAVKKYKPKSFILGGGVSANNRLKEKFVNEFEKSGVKTKFYAPDPKMSTDNAAAIAACAFYNNEPVDWRNIFANPGLQIVENK
jgi:N6-L-threonylcarbamoyladenine synthase